MHDWLVAGLDIDGDGSVVRDLDPVGGEGLLLVAADLGGRKGDTMLTDDRGRA